MLRTKFVTFFLASLFFVAACGESSTQKDDLVIRNFTVHPGMEAARSFKAADNCLQWQRLRNGKEVLRISPLACPANNGHVRRIIQPEPLVQMTSPTTGVFRANGHIIGRFTVTNPGTPGATYTAMTLCSHEHLRHCTLNTSNNKFVSVQNITTPTP